MSYNANYDDDCGTGEALSFLIVFIPLCHLQSFGMNCSTHLAVALMAQNGAEQF